MEMAKLKQAQLMTLSPQVSHQVDLDQGLRQIMQRTDMTPEEKMKLYASQQRDFLHAYKSPTGAVTAPLISSTQSDETQSPHEQVDTHEIKTLISSSISSRNKSKAMNILNFLKRDPDVLSYDQQGRLIYRGQIVPGSHVYDLVSDLLKTKKSTVSPVGNEELLRGLSSLNMPLNFVTNTMYKKKLQEFQSEKEMPVSSPATPLQRTMSRLQTKNQRLRKQRLYNVY